MTSSSILTEALEQRLFLSASRTAAVADFNGDGKADIVSLDIRSSRQQGTLILGFRAGNGDGTFAAPVQMAVPVYFDAKDPLFLLSGNFFGGPGADLIIVEGEGQVASGGIPGGGCIVTLNGNGDGTFIAGQPLPFTAPFTDVVAGDVNGDGLADLLFLSPAANHANLNTTAFLSDGQGAFFQQQGGGLIPLGNADDVTLADLNGDGKADLAGVTGGKLTSILTTLNGNGDGTFALQNNTYTLPGLNAPGVVAGDFNGDGTTDIIIEGGIVVQGGIIIQGGIVVQGGIRNLTAVLTLANDNSGALGTPVISVLNVREAALRVREAALKVREAALHVREAAVHFFAASVDPNNPNSPNPLDLLAFNPHRNGSVTTLFGDGLGHFVPGPHVILHRADQGSGPNNLLA